MGKRNKARDPDRRPAKSNEVQMTSSEELISCPYDSYHLILKSRFSAHLCKCRKRHPQTDFVICPFNATHNILKPELQYHIENCPDRNKLDSHLYVVDDPLLTPDSTYCKNDIVVPPASENWEEMPPAPTSYLDVKESVIVKKKVLRAPAGKSKSERRKFFEEECKRFEGFVRDESNSQKCGPYGSSVPGYAGPSSASRPWDESHLCRESHVSAQRPRADNNDDDNDDDDEEEFSVVLKGRGRGRASFKQLQY